ncbi:hypothetical protein ACI2KR_27135 [Pseudomonas luteola]
MKLYHDSNTNNRSSIMHLGLSCLFDKTGYGGIFLASERPEASACFDIWEVETVGLAIEPDFSTEASAGEWYMCFENIDPSRLRLESDPL